MSDVSVIDKGFLPNAVKGKKGLVYGWGINDSNFKVTSKDENGKLIPHPIYRLWVNMIRRCYSGDLRTLSTYQDKSVCEEWRYFSNFYNWTITKDYKNKQLDKDIIKPENKIYSPDTCCFVTQKLNGLLVFGDAIRGDLPLGVTRSNKKFRGQISIDGKNVTLGEFYTIVEAELAYLNAKINEIKNNITILIEENKLDNENIINGLKLWINKFEKRIEEIN